MFVIYSLTFGGPGIKTVDRLEVWSFRVCERHSSDSSYSATIRRAVWHQAAVRNVQFYSERKDKYKKIKWLPSPRLCVRL